MIKLEAITISLAHGRNVIVFVRLIVDVDSSF